MQHISHFRLDRGVKRAPIYSEMGIVLRRVGISERVDCS